MTQRKSMPPMFTPDLVVTDPVTGVESLYSLWGFRNNDRVTSIGQNHSPDIIADRLRQVLDPQTRKQNESHRLWIRP